MAGEIYLDLLQVCLVFVTPLQTFRATLAHQCLFNLGRLIKQLNVNIILGSKCTVL